jgi:hypothetical protein
MIARYIGGFLVMVIVAMASVGAQKSAAADKQAASWFNNGRDSFLQRMPAMQKEDVDVWEAAAKKAGIDASRASLGFTIPKFNPLFDAKNQVVAGAMAKYAKRFEQLPAKAVEDWAALTGGDKLVVALSLTAENNLFPGEKFSEPAFRTLATKFK